MPKSREPDDQKIVGLSGIHDLLLIHQHIELSLQPENTHPNRPFGGTLKSQIHLGVPDTQSVNFELIKKLRQHRTNDS